MKIFSMKKTIERRNSYLANLYSNNNNNNPKNNDIPSDGVYEKGLNSRRRSIQPSPSLLSTSIVQFREDKEREKSNNNNRRNSITAFLFPKSGQNEENSSSFLENSTSIRLKNRQSFLFEDEHFGNECDYLCIEGPSPSASQLSIGLFSPPLDKGRRGSRSSYSLFHSSAGPVPVTIRGTGNNSSHLISADATRWMGRGAMRVVVVGAKRCGKTAILRQVACLEDATKMPYVPTLDDTYQVLLEEADRPREILVFHDTAGIPEYGPIELRRPYIQVADAFVLVYSVTDHESFNRMDLLKKFIEKQFGKEKKEVPIVVLGTMCDLPGRKVDPDFAQSWAQKERVRLYEVTSTDRTTLVDFVQYLGQRHFHPQKDSLKFSLSKKLKSEKASPAIMMDF